MNTASTHSSMADRQETEAFDFVRKMRRFYIHLFRYAVVSIVLLIVNLTVIPNKMWVYWVIAAWGLGVLLHASRVFRPDWFLGPQWEREQVEKRLGRPL